MDVNALSASSPGFRPAASGMASQDEAAIRDLHATYWARTDGTDTGRPEDLFSDEAVFVLGSLTLTGRDEVAAFFRKRQADQTAAGRVTRHLASGLQLRLVSDGRVETKCTVLAMAGFGSLPIVSSAPSVADFIDVCVRLPGDEWRFERRSATSVFVGPEAPSFAHSPTAISEDPKKDKEC